MIEAELMIADALGAESEAATLRDLRSLLTEADTHHEEMNIAINMTIISLVAVVMTEMKEVAKEVVTRDEIKAVTESQTSALNVTKKVILLGIVLKVVTTEEGATKEGMTDETMTVAAGETISD